MDKVLISISGQKNNESYPLCSLDRSIPDTHFILNLAIICERKKAIQTFFTLRVKRFIDNTTVVQYIIKLFGIYSPSLCIEVWKTLLVPETQCKSRKSLYSREI